MACLPATTARVDSPEGPTQVDSAAQVFRCVLRREDTRLTRYRDSAAGWRRMQRKPMCVVEESSDSGERAAGRKRRQYSGEHRCDPPLRTRRGPSPGTCDMGRSEEHTSE